MTISANRIRRSLAGVAAGLLAGTALTSTLASPASAAPVLRPAGTIEVVGEALRIQLAPGTDSRLEAFPAAGLLGVTYKDQSAGLTPGAGCSRLRTPYEGHISCRGYRWVSVVAGDGNDVIDLAAEPSDAGVDGGDGDDHITVGDGTNVLHGGAGDDWLLGGYGPDAYNGGPGYDSIWYHDQYGSGAPVKPVKVTFDGAANDGAAGEGDNVGFDVEFVLGGEGDDTLIAPSFSLAGVYLGGAEGNDTIVGSNGPDTLNGGQGDDTIFGGAGDDHLEGYSGNDRLYGDAGDDYLSGNVGDDTLHGGAGNDLLTGYHGSDGLFGGDGDDELHGDDGYDGATGQAGHDTCVAEVKVTCEA